MAQGVLLDGSGKCQPHDQFNPGLGYYQTTCTGTPPVWMFTNYSDSQCNNQIQMFSGLSCGVCLPPLPSLRALDLLTFFFFAPLENNSAMPAELRSGSTATETTARRRW
jgi:hypothetical protein